MYMVYNRLSLSWGVQFKYVHPVIQCQLNVITINILVGMLFMHFHSYAVYAEALEYIVDFSCAFPTVIISLKPLDLALHLFQSVSVVS